MQVPLDRIPVILWVLILVANSSPRKGGLSGFHETCVRTPYKAGHSTNVMGCCHNNVFALEALCGPTILDLLQSLFVGKQSIIIIVN